MSRDLEEQLNEMGGDYRRVVDRLKGAYAPLSQVDLARTRPVAPSQHPARIAAWTVGYLVAASLLVFLGLSFIFNGETTQEKVYTVRVTDAKTEYSLAYMRTEEAIGSIIRSQNNDGSWANDFLTRQNAEALRRCPSPEARIAYKRAVRNLRSRGLL